ncbi:MAG: hypothetical protein FWC41_04830 [Firmicutes bacterium]|nr:hypothetical protein [Bacillota bacterium]
MKKHDIYKTIKEIADEIDVSKQRVYRYIKKNRISEVHHDNGMMYYDEVAEARIKEHFAKSAVSDEAHHESHQSVLSDTVVDTIIMMLQRELEVKNQLIKEQQQTIKELNTTVRIQAESINAARHAELAETIIDGQTNISMLNDGVEKKQRRFWQFWKKQK